MLSRSRLFTPIDNRAFTLISKYPHSSYDVSVSHSKRGSDMLYTIAVILAVLWLAGLVSSYTLGGFIHILLVIAVIVFVVGLLGGRKAA